MKQEKSRDIFDIQAEKICEVRTTMSKDKFQEYLANKLRHYHKNAKEELRSSIRDLLDIPSNNDIKDFVRDYND